MQEPNLFGIYTEILSKNRIDYFVTGSVATIVYGEPRMTHDIDLIISLPEINIDRFMTLFPIDKFYCPPKEVIINEIKRSSRGHINLIHHESGFKADVYFVGQDKLQIWAMANRIEIDYLGGIIYIAPIEYVILKKLEFYKESESQKHILDIESMLNNSENMIDFLFLNKKIEELGLSTIWKLIQSN
jgi:hypothetical protein